MMCHEKELVISAQQGSQVAVEKLFYLNKDKIYRLAFCYVKNQQDAEDLLQDIFTKAFLALEKFNPHGDARFSTWLYRIGINSSINYLRKNKKFSNEHQIEDYLKYEPDDQVPNPEETMITSEMYELIEANLSGLSPKQRMIFTLRYIHDKKVKNIADLMNCSEGSIKKQLFRALTKLKMSLRSKLEVGNEV